MKAIAVTPGMPELLDTLTTGTNMIKVYCEVAPTEGR